MTGINEWLQLILITLLPGVELRGSIPYGILIGLEPSLVFIVAIIINVLMVFPAYLVVMYIFPYLRKVKIIDRIISRSQEKAGKYVEKYGFWGLLIFVAIPLPGSGIYSGVIAAYFLGIKRRFAIPAMTLGVVIAGIVIFVGTLLATGNGLAS